MQRKLVYRELTAQGAGGGPGVGPKRRNPTVNIAEAPLTWLHAHDHLDDRQFDAGERLRAQRAQLGPWMTMRWESVRIRGGGDAGLNATERQIGARRASTALLTRPARARPTFRGGWYGPGRPCRTGKRR